MPKTDQELIELFQDLIPAPSKAHIVVPQYQGAVHTPEFAASKNTMLLAEKGGLLVAMGIEARNRFGNNIKTGDRVWLSGHFSQEAFIGRDGEYMLVVDASFIAMYQKPGTGPKEESILDLNSVGQA